MNCEVRFCGKEINYDGALLFGPPDKEFNTKKIHICKDCYKSLFKDLIVSVKNPPPTIISVPGYFLSVGKMDTVYEQGPQRVAGQIEGIIDFHLPSVIQAPASHRGSGPFPPRCCCRCC